MKQVLAVLLALAGVAHADEDRSKNTAPVLPKWPVRTSKAPVMHKELVAIAKLQNEFKDKKILKLAVARVWKERDWRDGVWTRHWAATIGVFDPQNNKCWVWDELNYYKSDTSGRVLFRGAEGDVFEINCARLK